MTIEKHSVNRPQASATALDIRRLSGQIAVLNGTGDFLNLAVRLINAAGGMIFRSAGEGMEVVEELLSRQALAWSDNLRQEMALGAYAALTKESIDCHRLDTAAGAWIVSCPVSGEGQGLSLSLLILVGNNPLEPFLVIAQLLASLLAAQHLGRQCITQTDPGNEEKLLTLLAGALTTDDPREALLHLNSALKGWADCLELAIGMVSPTGQVELRSLANVTTIDQRTDYARNIGTVMRECVSRERMLAWPESKGGPESSPVLAEAAASIRAGQLLALPLKMADKPVNGVLVLLWDSGKGQDRLYGRLHRTAPLLAAVLARAVQPQRLRGGTLTGASLHSPFGRRRLLFSLFGAAALILVTLVPLPFRISADCVTQPVSSRAIVSRFDGILQEVLVQPGDQLQAGAVLAHLDGRELELQFGGLTAERNKAAKLRDQYLATGETALAQIAQLDSQRFEAQLSQIREKQQHLAITSPIAGIVLSGDLKRAEGSPVNRGQILFEIAPLARMEVEISVPEREIALVTAGLPVQIRFTAYPDTSWRGSIDQIVPKSQIRGNSNVFLARMQFDNADGLLRPGMRGEGKIAAGWRPIGWQLFRKPWHTLRSLADQIF